MRAGSGSDAYGAHAQRCTPHGVDLRLRSGAPWRATMARRRAARRMRTGPRVSWLQGVARWQRQCRGHPVASFFVLAFAVSWLAVRGSGWRRLARAFPGSRSGRRSPGSRSRPGPRDAPGVCASCAAMGRWRVATGLVPGAVGLPVAMPGRRDPVEPAARRAGAELGRGAAARSRSCRGWRSTPSFSGPLGEEPGWRGFALPRMLRGQGALAASLVLGAIWAAWHLPLGLVGDLTRLWHGERVRRRWCSPGSGRTPGSVLLAILMHVAHQNAVRYLGRVYEGPTRSSSSGSRWRSGRWSRWRSC